jgi:hypothetical protein
LFCNTTGVGNTAVGQASLGYATTGARNTALGLVAGCCITSGACNVILGSATANGFGTESCNIFISDGAGNIRIFATGSTGAVGINTTTPLHTLHVEGTTANSNTGYISTIFTSGSVIADATTNGTLFTIDTTTYESLAMEYTVFTPDKNNKRAGIFRSTWDEDNTSIVYAEASTTDIGDTSNFTLDAVNDGAGTVTVRASNNLGNQVTLIYERKLLG